MRYPVRLKNISLTYQSPRAETAAVEDVSLQVSEGEFISIIGPSGCGKSTLLDIICGLTSPSRGQAIVDGKIGYMLQRDYLLEWRTIMKNCLLGPEVQGLDMKEARAYVNILLQKYGLAAFASHFPRQLSGGMRQRAALIRTLAVKPDIMLLDEAFSALDYQTRLAVADEVWGILRRERKTAIMVTHDISEAISMADRIVLLTPRPAKVKDIYNIKLGDGSPLERRKHELFRQYFNTIWKELDVHVSI